MEDLESKSLLHGDVAKKPDIPWYKSKRYQLTILAFLGFFNVYALRVNLSVAIVKMSSEYGWDNSDSTMILSSFFYGYIITQLPGGWLATRIGAKYVFGYGVLCTTLLTLLTPVVSKWFGVLIALRVIEGFGEGVTYPAMHAMLSRWAPPSERTRMATICYSGAYMGTVLALPISGVLASWWWPSVFYVFGGLGTLWFALWMFLARNSPQEHKYITNAERSYIVESISSHKDPAAKAVIPWKHIFSSPAVWAIITNHFTNNWGFYTLLTCLPTYFNDVLRFNLSKSGILSALPYMLIFLVTLSGGQVADYLRYKGILKTIVVRKVFNTIAYILGATFLILCGYVRHGEKNEHLLAVAFITLANGVIGLANSGFNVNHLDISPKYAGILMGITNGFATIPGFLGPIVAGVLAKCGLCDDSKSKFNNLYWEGKSKCPTTQEEYLEHKCTVDDAAHQWRIVFLISAGIFLFGALVFLMLGKATPQKFDSMGNNDDDNSDNTTAKLGKNGVAINKQPNDAHPST